MTVLEEADRFLTTRKKRSHLSVATSSGSCSSSRDENVDKMLSAEHTTSIADNHVLTSSRKHKENSYPLEETKRKRLHLTAGDSMYQQQSSIGGTSGLVYNDLPQRQFHLLSNAVSLSPLTNVGNTCFLNSVLYVLRFTPNFVHQLHHLVVNMQAMRAQTTPFAALLATSKSCAIVQQLHDLYARMQLSERNETSAYEACDPSDFLHAFQVVHGDFEGHRQQDVHEFLLCLLGTIRDAGELLIQHVQTNPNSVSVSAVSSATEQQQQPSKLWNLGVFNGALNQKRSNSTSGGSSSSSSSQHVSSTNLSNFIVEDFEGRSVRCTQCLECEKASVCAESFFDIDMPCNAAVVNSTVHNVNVNDIYWKACMDSETLSGDNKYLCDCCLRYTEAMRAVQFETLPAILIFQLKRFTASAQGHAEKITDHVPTPLQLDCACNLCRDKRQLKRRHFYRLSGVIMHLGMSAAAGHYISYVRVCASATVAQHCPYLTLTATPGGADTTATTATPLTSKQALKQFVLQKARFTNANSNTVNGSGCRAKSCCSVQLQPYQRSRDYNNSSSGSSADSNEDIWLECDDDSIHAITVDELRAKLSDTPGSSAATPYLLFFTRQTID